jgi:hypothetical protein
VPVDDSRRPPHGVKWFAQQTISAISYQRKKLTADG